MNLQSLVAVPVVFSPWYDRNAPPVFIDGVIYGCDAEHVRQWLESIQTEAQKAGKS